MPSRPEEPNGNPADRRARRGGDEVGSSGAEAHDGDPGGHGVSDDEEDDGAGELVLRSSVGGLIWYVEESNLP